MVSKNQGNPIRPLSRRAVIGQSVGWHEERFPTKQESINVVQKRTSPHHPFPENWSLQNKDGKVTRVDCEGDQFSSD